MRSNRLAGHTLPGEGRSNGPTMTIRDPLPAAAIFDDPGSDPHAPGWRTDDPFHGWMTPGHIDAEAFGRRVRPEDAPGVDPDTIRHEWVVLSHHDKGCVPDPEGDDPGNDSWYCCGMFRTGWEDADGRAVHVHDATSDAPGAIPVTWGYPKVELTAPASR